MNKLYGAFKRSYRLWRPTHPPIQWLPVAFPREGGGERVNWPGHEADDLFNL